MKKSVRDTIYVHEKKRTSKRIRTGFVCVCQEREDLDSKRTAYINCVTAIDHNNEQIGVLLGDLKTYRQQLLLALQTASGVWTRNNI